MSASSRGTARIPGPWKRIAWTTNPNHEGTDVVAEVNGRVEVIATCTGNGQDFDQGVAHAAFIVEACNSHRALVAALTELYAQVKGECPSLLDEDSGGDASLDLQIQALLSPQRASGNQE